MKFYKLLFTKFIFLLVFVLHAAAQNDVTVLNKIMTKTAKVFENYPIEKVYLHFDKPYYAVGDTMWFKAYLTIDRHQPSILSKIIYVDVLGPRDSLVQSLKLQVKSCVSWASIPLSQYVYKKGNYRVVAYTNWMNNSDVSYFFNKTFTLGDAINNNISTQIALKSVPTSKASKVSADIYYKDNDGKPYVEKRVNWSIEKDDETIAKGKGTTDKNGFIDITFVNLKNIALDSAKLITAIDGGFHKDITSTFSLKSVAKPNDIQFFPEGGQLLIGVRSKIAFKAVKPDGQGIDATGTIVDNTGKTVAEFSSTHLGMGAFVLTPEDGKTYAARVNFADGTSAAPDLPKIQTGGVDLSLENSKPDSLGLKLLTDAEFFKEYQGQTFFILAKSAGVICYAAKTQLKSQVYSASIPKNKFPTGILQVTLFMPDGDPVSERIVFIQHNDLLNVSINADHPDYTTRQLVKLNVMAKNYGVPEEANFSVAVVDESKVPYDDDASTTILSNLLLTADIKGYIEKPNYYFNHTDDKAAADLDILLMTQGYTRYSYDNILDNKYPPIKFLPEQGIDITGTLRAGNGIAVPHGIVNISIPDKNYYNHAETDIDGHFKFTGLIFPDSAKVKLSARDNEHSSALVLMVDGDHGQAVPININKPDEVVNIDSVLKHYIDNSKQQVKNSHVLHEVVIKDTKIQKVVPSHRDYTALASLGDQPDHIVSGEQLKDCNSVFECLKTMLSGMIYDDGNFYVFNDYSKGNRTPVAIFLKGTPVDINFLATLDPHNIESVEVFLKDQLGLVNSANNTNGAIVINLKKIETQKISLSDLKAMLPQQNEVTYTPRGYTVVKIFYLPRYDMPREKQPTAVDLRSTIYWNPNVTTDKTGNALLQYFNADGRGPYRVIIEGMDKDGNLGRQVFKYNVK